MLVEMPFATKSSYEKTKLLIRNLEKMEDDVYSNIHENISFFIQNLSQGSENKNYEMLWSTAFNGKKKTFNPQSCVEKRSGNGIKDINWKI